MIRLSPSSRDFRRCQYLTETLFSGESVGLGIGLPFSTTSSDFVVCLYVGFQLCGTDRLRPCQVSLYRPSLVVTGVVSSAGYLSPQLPATSVPASTFSVDPI